MRKDGTFVRCEPVLFSEHLIQRHARVLSIFRVPRHDYSVDFVDRDYHGPCCLAAMFKILQASCPPPNKHSLKFAPARVENEIPPRWRRISSTLSFLSPAERRSLSLCVYRFIRKHFRRLQILCDVTQLRLYIPAYWYGTSRMPECVNRMNRWN